MKLSELQIEDCSNIDYTDECDLGSNSNSYYIGIILCINFIKVLMSSNTRLMKFIIYHPGPGTPYDPLIFDSKFSIKKQEMIQLNRSLNWCYGKGRFRF